jgi:hypothetical protein
VSALERLDTIDRRAGALSPSPWVLHEGIIWRSTKAQLEAFDAHPERLDVDEWPTAVHGSDFDDDLGEFLAHARQDVPVMATALRAILNLHQAVGQRVGPPICGGCSNELASALHPCATVRIIETELAR